MFAGVPSAGARAADWSIARARVAQVPALCAIEREAVQAFRGHPAWSAYAAMPVPPAQLEAAVTRGSVWVALGPAAQPVGFIWLEELGDAGALGLVELDVLPAHGRQGIGAALLEHACAWARAAGYARIDLATLADVPWNAPFYARHGFVTVDRHDPAFAHARRRDRENGLPAALRVFMSRPLPPPGPDDWTVWPAPAKLNLFLRITGRRADGYHELQTVFRLLDWGDELHLRVRPDDAVVRLTDVPGVPAEDDLVVRAARLLQAHAGGRLGVDIAIDKRLPMGGGLGGGSSDAASTLVALNHLWRTGLAEDALAELGRRLGADVPVFVRGRSAWAEGVGERLDPLPLPQRWYVVVVPGVHVSTAALFQAPELTRNAPRATISRFTAGQVTDNVFEPLVRARHRQVAAALDWLGRFGRARLSGTGACVFLETASAAQARRVARQCPADFVAHVAEGQDASSLMATLARHRARIDREPA